MLFLKGFQVFFRLFQFAFQDLGLLLEKPVGLRAFVDLKVAVEIDAHQGVDHCGRQTRVLVRETDVDDIGFPNPLDFDVFPKPDYRSVQGKFSSARGLKETAQKPVACPVEVLVNDRRSKGLGHLFGQKSALENLDL